MWAGERPNAGVPAPRSTLDQRMRGEMPGDPHGGGMGGGGMGGGAPRPGVSFTWSTPVGWEALPAAPMRTAGWKVTARSDVATRAKRVRLFIVEQF